MAEVAWFEHTSYDFGDRYSTVKLHPYIGGSGGTWTHKKSLGYEPSALANCATEPRKKMVISR